MMETHKDLTDWGKLSRKDESQEEQIAFSAIRHE